MSISSSPISYLLLRDCHVVPLTTLAPDAIKESVKKVLRNPDQEIRHTTALNAVAKHLGFEGGFPGYLRRWPELEKFLGDRGMKDRVDFADDWGGPVPARLHLRRREIADRLFQSGRPAPGRLFVGHGFDWSPYDRLRDEIVFARDAKVDPFRHNRDWDAGRARAGEAKDLQSLLLAYHFSSLVSPTLGLLHDGLVFPRDSEDVIVELYYAESHPREQRTQELRQAREAFGMLRAHLDVSIEGWAEVTRFPASNLFFLHTRDGAWDFFFPHLRDTPPPQRPFDRELDVGDVPRSFYVSEQFDTWLYFRREGWLAEDVHAAETRFYSNGGTLQTYPGSTNILRDHYHAVGKFMPVRAAGKREPLSGFRRVRLPDGKSLQVSDLVSIAEYRRFHADTSYAERRVEQINRWDPANRDPDHLPVTVNFYDALAYCAWLERYTDHPLRLLHIAEYRMIHPGASEIPAERELPWLPWVYRHGCIEILGNDGQSESSGGFIGDDQTVRFKSKLEWRLGLGGLRFLVSYSFAEWLFEHSGQEAAAINTLHLRSAHDADPVERDYFPASSWGKYRFTKIGFRLCFDDETK